LIKGENVEKCILEKKIIGLYLEAHEKEHNKHKVMRKWSLVATSKLQNLSFSG